MKTRKTIGRSQSLDQASETEKAARFWEYMKCLVEEGVEKQAHKLEMIYQIRKVTKEYGL